MNQLYIGICQRDNDRYRSPKNKCDSRFNCQLFPTQNINKQLQPILKCLRYINDNSAECVAYRRSKQSFDSGFIDEAPKVPVTMQLIGYWSKLNNIIYNHIIELILSYAESFGNSTGKTHRCIVENYESVNRFEQKLLWFQNKKMFDFAVQAVEVKDDEEDIDVPPLNVSDGTYDEPNAINDLLQTLEIEPDRRVWSFIFKNSSKSTNFSFYRLSVLKMSTEIYSLRNSPNYPSPSSLSFPNTSKQRRGSFIESSRICLIRNHLQFTPISMTQHSTERMESVGKRRWTK